MKFAPVVVFAYKRPDTLQRMLRSLASNAESAGTHLVIFCDGPKQGAGPRELKGIEAVRQVATSVQGFKLVEVVAAEKNKGLARSVIDGVTHATERFGRAIIVEDDAVLSPYFLQFMNEALDQFSEEEMVFSVGSWNYFVDPAAVKGNFFFRYPDSLAWATWKRSWDLFEKDGAKLLAGLKQRKLIDRLDGDGQVSYFSRMLEAQVKGRIDSWAIRWTANCILQGKLNYFPRTTLALNEGFGEDATHEREGAAPYAGLRLAMEPQPVLPLPVEEDPVAMQHWTAFIKYHFEGGSDPSLKGRVWRNMPKSVQERYHGIKRSRAVEATVDGLKTAARRVVYGKPREEDRLIAEAAKFPRFTDTTIAYKGWRLKVTDMLSVAWQIKEFFGEERMKFHTESAAPVVVDCGANVGVSVLYCKSGHPQARVICFEPDPQVRACLEENIMINGIKGVEVRNEVVWTHAEGVAFSSDGADGGSVLRDGPKVTMPSVRLKDVLREHESIDLLKIDIEGAETEVLLDCAEELERVKFLYVEYHSFPESPQRLDELLHVLRTRGFRYYIHSIGVHHEHPFAGPGRAEMDVQLDIHAIRQ